MPQSDQKSRPIRSYVLRQGRMTEGQQRAYEALWPRYGVELADGQLDLSERFEQTQPVTLEIGFGNGESLRQLAQKQPEHNFLGVEVHGPGVGHLMIQLDQHQLSNVRILKHDAMELLRHHLQPGSLQRVLLYFPDPWHKRKHNKRRIVQDEFAELVHRALIPGGILHMATDWEDYALQMMSVLSAHQGFDNQAGEGNFSPRPETRPLTKFEQRGERLGHGVWDLLFERLA
ncbi:MAG: tRNA (guanosine(46)-N7)-methyltransferase TrmB [Candidatus Thiodiazotropha lotti]|uniref:tRNA (guanosine(46)-N7)-methyltransferase TrmB n=1 Tax=Candidatus Thiodiazotropha endoloripes TaxID=1818881 RepID=UPI00083E12FF|nr:tRNA (guanosine(46)-N7)-methyltransferase TrmB [Candidatus Thiodiazotropha endoloripes]MCG7991785.1 tRNA (guanosine(46)-N7)-methyltransferase TrmB [Candidatus Thiodiazotropha lotti]MCW4183441.1 tRNA (guanosine(46)-N7)-methyltransferase TrmB [Candidatus Thiodiazotropha weberae]MCG8000486.1 tRNA (guanosine(46)-N7)-methyltransferase TrmB [Candidatus Thiodiazotropha lotti]MCW4192257.1 tRNA (guanosine(46)-N7)-methyltransferase TrmB [Candidatus Thiodiazotropha weberae]ODB91597.1 tRNA (guanosine(4